MIVVLGDMLDFPYLSTKFARKHAAPQDLLGDLAVAREMLQFYRANCGRLIFIEGNHEARFTNYIMECAPALEPLVDGPLNLPALLNIEGMEYVGPYGEVFIYHSIVFKHGDVASQYAAHSELTAEGSSGISGHTHRLQVAARSDRGGAHAWYSMPALCHVKGRRMPPGYHNGASIVRNQQQGFGLVYCDEIFNIYPIIITDGMAITPEGSFYA